jgi:magnesium chelatase family protein
MASVVNSFAITGIDGYVVTIETDIIFGKPSFSIVGLGDAAIREATQRIESAIINSKFEFPKIKILINLAPGNIKKSGTHFDLPMAIGLLLQSKQVIIEEIQSFGLIGELSLNGELRPCAGILPMVIEAKDKGIRNIIVPKQNMQEAALVKDINIFGFNTLAEVTNFLEGTSTYNNYDISKGHIIQRKYMLDFQDVQGQDIAINYVVMAAAGGHNLLMSGAPGCGKSMIAKRIPTILPSMTEEEALEVTKIYSVAGLLRNSGTLKTERPFRDPHHNASTNALVGGGNNALPGEISLAHNGVLFLDEIAEFNKKTLDALRQPLEDGKVTVSRVKYTHIYPSNFMLVAAMNPCPCGYYGNAKCHCSDYEVLKYRQKLSGPIMDRIDIQNFLAQVDIMNLSNNTKGPESQNLRKKIEEVRDIQRKRFGKFSGINCNAQMTPALIAEFCKIDEQSKILFKLAFDKFNYSARSFHKFLKIARTIADLEGENNINYSHVSKALMCRQIDKEETTMEVI